MMTLRERLDTNPARSQERSMSVAISEDPGPIAMELEVENLATVDLHDVVVTRPLASEMNFEMAGGAELDEGVITWTVGRLAAGEKQTSFRFVGTLSFRWIRPNAPLENGYVLIMRPRIRRTVATLRN